MANEVFDVVIVGSGASGGWAAKQLTESGLKVAVLEAGRRLDPNTDFTEHKLAHDMPLRGSAHPPKDWREQQPIQKLCYQCDEYAHELFVKDTEHPYTTVSGKPFQWIRGRHVGGKSIMWARQSYRLSDLDLKAASRDGWGADWPITYAELAPYYDRVEDFVGISGQAEGLPQLPDSRFLPPMELTCGERLLQGTIKKKFPGRLLTIGRTAVLTKALNGRPACHYCGPCGRGCSAGSYYSSPASTLPAAEKTGKLTLVTNAVVSHVVLDDAGRCRGVAYVDRMTREPREAFGKVVVLCASTLETTRILLNSRSSRAPNGLSNSSGVVGHYLMDHIMGAGAKGTMPMLKGIPDPRGNRPNGVYIPRFRNVTEKHPDFLRGYGYQGSAEESKWGHAFALPGFGASFKNAVRSRPWTIHLSGFGESLARVENRCEIDPEARDAWGIPVLRFDMAFADNEKKMIKDMADNAEEMLKAAGAIDIVREEDMAAPGLAIHEVGTARMGDDPRASAVNRWQQSHDVRNLFLMDGSVYPSSACQNPTLTIMALASRACDYLVEQLRTGAV
jgi:choline dehydrogenase-like flavoprotein